MFINDLKVIIKYYQFSIYFSIDNVLQCLKLINFILLDDKFQDMVHVKQSDYNHVTKLSKDVFNHYKSIDLVFKNYSGGIFDDVYSSLVFDNHIVLLDFLFVITYCYYYSEL